MGCFWNMSAKRERVWVYGSTWLCMFDLSQDLPVPGDNDKSPEERSDTRGKQDRKRKRAYDEVEELQAHTSGAGSKVHVAELSIASDRKMRKFEGEGDGDAQVITLGPQPEDVVTAEDAGAVERDLALSRRGVTNGIAADDGAGSSRDAKNTSVARGVKWALGSSGRDQRQGPPFWSTLRYRSVLGIVPIGRTQTAEAHSTGTGQDELNSEHLELAVIERPLAELDLPPRFYGDQDYHQ
jgi:U3 small nucleolar RNA-associated protein 4